MTSTAVDAATLGMSPESAHSHAHDYVRAIRHNVTIQQAFRRVGLDPMRVADKLNKLIDAKEPKWNPAKKRWDTFENTTAQLEPIKQTVKLLNLYPIEPAAQEPITVNLIIDVYLWTIANASRRGIAVRHGDCRRARAISPFTDCRAGIGIQSLCTS
jgi:hypothetical protein